MNSFPCGEACGLFVGAACLKGVQWWLELKGLHNDSLSSYLVILLSIVPLKTLSPLSSCLIQNP